MKHQLQPLVPAWAVLPFATTTAAAGLYLAWVKREKGGGKQEPDFKDLGESEYGQFLKNNKKIARIITFNNTRRKSLENFWKDSLDDTFVNAPYHSWSYSHQRPITYMNDHKLMESFDLQFPKQKSQWTDVEQAEKDIKARVDYLWKKFTGHN